MWWILYIFEGANGSLLIFQTLLSHAINSSKSGKKKKKKAAAAKAAEETAAAPVVDAAKA